MSKVTGTCSRCHGQHDGNHVSYCQTCWREYQRERWHGLLPVPELRACVTCGHEFRPRKNDDRDNPAKCCSVACNVKHQNLIRTPEQIRTWRLRTAYGISLSDYDRMLEAQDGGCAVCGDPGELSARGVLHVDHCHQTGRIRGLLCSNCNRAMGQFPDDPVLLRRAASYIEEALMAQQRADVSVPPGVGVAAQDYSSSGQAGGGVGGAVGAPGGPGAQPGGGGLRGNHASGLDPGAPA